MNCSSEATVIEGPQETLQVSQPAQEIPGHNVSDVSKVMDTSNLGLHKQQSPKALSTSYLIITTSSFVTTTTLMSVNISTDSYNSASFHNGNISIFAICLYSILKMCGQGF